MLELKLIHVSKRGLRYYIVYTVGPATVYHITRHFIVSFGGQFDNSFCFIPYSQATLQMI